MRFSWRFHRLFKSDIWHMIQISGIVCIRDDHLFPVIKFQNIVKYTVIYDIPSEYYNEKWLLMTKMFVFFFHSKNEIATHSCIINSLLFLNSNNSDNLYSICITLTILLLQCSFYSLMQRKKKNAFFQSLSLFLIF